MKTTAGERLRSQREKMGWTQEQAASLAKVSVKTVARAEQDAQMSLREVLRQVGRVADGGGSMTAPISLSPQELADLKKLMADQAHEKAVASLRLRRAAEEMLRRVNGKPDR